jgi:hypothetical protein
LAQLSNCLVRKETTLPDDPQVDNFMNVEFRIILSIGGHKTGGDLPFTFLSPLNLVSPLVAWLLNYELLLSNVHHV